MDAVLQELAKQYPAEAFLRVRHNRACIRFRTCMLFLVHILCHLQVEAEEVDAVTEKCGVTTVPYFVFYKVNAQEHLHELCKHACNRLCKFLLSTVITLL
jgi:hypothetical protein